MEIVRLIYGVKANPSPPCGCSPEDEDALVASGVIFIFQLVLNMTEGKRDMEIAESVKL